MSKISQLVSALAGDAYKEATRAQAMIWRALALLSFAMLVITITLFI